MDTGTMFGLIMVMVGLFIWYLVDLWSAGGGYDNYKYAEIDKAIISGRYEDAAVLYESMGMYEDAGKMREHQRTNKNITVDLNKMVELINVGYKCSSCSAPLIIEDDDEIVDCPYCGTSFNVDAMKKTISVIYE